MNQQDFNNAGGWGDFDNNFKQPGNEEQKQNTANSAFGFAGFSNF